MVFDYRKHVNLCELDLVFHRRRMRRVGVAVDAAIVGVPRKLFPGAVPGPTVLVWVLEEMVIRREVVHS